MDYNYTTQVKIDLKGLPTTLQELKDRYDEIGTRDTHEGRSRFSQWNNMQKFYERINNNLDTTTIQVTGSAKGNSARVYFKPSVTSIAKPFRKHILPLKDENEFVFFDLRAAEFFMNCVFCQETEAIDAYQRGEDIYMHYAYIFPEGTPRATIKKILIANMYNKTAYSTALDLGISETQAQRLLDLVANTLPRMTMNKRKVYAYDLKHKGYFAPRGFNQNDLVKVADIDPVKGFNPDYAMSCYVQSALGFFMQDVTTKLLPKTQGTVLSVFDSMLVEINPANRDRFVDWMKTSISPFITDDFTFGKTFYEAAYGKE